MFSFTDSYIGFLASFYVIVGKCRIVVLKSYNVRKKRKKKWDPDHYPNVEEDE